MGDSKSSLSRSLKMIQYWKWQLTDQAGMLPLRDVDRLQKWANTNLCSSTKEMQSPAAQEHRLGANKQKEAEKGLIFLVDIKLTMSLQTTFGANKVNSMWAALGETTTSRSREGIFPLCSGLVR